MKKAIFNFDKQYFHDKKLFLFSTINIYTRKSHFYFEKTLFSTKKQLFFWRNCIYKQQSNFHFEETVLSFSKRHYFHIEQPVLSSLTEGRTTFILAKH